MIFQESDLILVLAMYKMMDRLSEKYNLSWSDLPLEAFRVASQLEEDKQDEVVDKAEQIYKQLRDGEQYYLIIVWGCVEPSVYDGPFYSYDDLLSATRKLYEEGGSDADTYIGLKVSINGPQVFSFSTEELEG